MKTARLALVMAFTLSCMAALGATPGRDVPGVRSGLIVVAPDRTSLAERVTFDAKTAAQLAAAAPDETVSVTDWPVAPGLRARARLTRREVYAPDAKVLRADGDQLVELPRSPLVFFWGPVDGESGARAVAWVDPATGVLEGTTLSRYGAQEIRHPRGAGAREALVGEAHSLSESPLAWSCGQESLPPTPERDPAPVRAAAAPLAADAATSQAILAFDTDNEFMQLKFSNDTNAATTYVASLVAVMTVIYERDLGIRIVQGNLILRPSTSSDPYASTGGGNASGSQLTEFGNYWKANYGSTGRALAQLLSGKQSSVYSASGIGWIGGLCSTTYGYSVAQVFKYAQQTASSDALVNAHEIGHNFGSPHTHCYSPPIDQCYSGEGGCYSGATSCPAAATYQGVASVKGTLMSYCHLLSGCSASLVFHPTSITYLQSYVNSAKSAGCITALSTPPAGPRFYTLPPCRAFDTRNANGTYGGPSVAAGASRSFPLNGRCGIPSTAVSVSLNVTAVAPPAGGFFTLYAGGTSLPATTSISFRAGQVRANNAVAGVSSDGTATLNVFNGSGSAANVVVDVNGYFR